MLYSTLHPRLIRTVCDFNKTHKKKNVAAKKHDELVFLSPRIDSLTIYDDVNDHAMIGWNIIRLPSGPILYMFDHHEGGSKNLGYALANPKTNIIRIYCDHELDYQQRMMIVDAKRIQFYIYTRSRSCVESAKLLFRDRIFIRHSINLMERRGYNDTGLHITKVDLAGNGDESDIFLDSIDIEKLQCLDKLDTGHNAIDAQYALYVLEERIRYDMMPITYLRLPRHIWKKHHNENIEVAYHVEDLEGKTLHPRQDPLTPDSNSSLSTMSFEELWKAIKHQ